MVIILVRLRTPAERSKMRQNPSKLVGWLLATTQVQDHFVVSIVISFMTDASLCVENCSQKFDLYKKIRRKKKLDHR